MNRANAGTRWALDRGPIRGKRCTALPRASSIPAHHHSQDTKLAQRNAPQERGHLPRSDKTTPSRAPPLFLIDRASPSDGARLCFDCGMPALSSCQRPVHDMPSQLNPALSLDEMNEARLCQDAPSFLEVSRHVGMKPAALMLGLGHRAGSAAWCQVPRRVRHATDTGSTRSRLPQSSRRSVRADPSQRHNLRFGAFSSVGLLRRGSV